MAALAGVAAFVAHGGIGGAIVESLLVLGIAIVFVAVWLRERRFPSRSEHERSSRSREDP